MTRFTTNYEKKINRVFMMQLHIKDKTTEKHIVTFYDENFFIH